MFSNTKFSNGRSSRAARTARARCDGYMRTPASPRQPPRTRHAKLVDVSPHAWQPGVVDPHWRFLVRTRTPNGVSLNYSLRYSDFLSIARDHEEAVPGVMHAMPERHWIPFVGKLFDGEAAAAQRAAELRRAIAPLFTDENPLRRSVDSGEALRDFPTTPAEGGTISAPDLSRRAAPPPAT